jgi:hypothetical protein
MSGKKPVLSRRNFLVSVGAGSAAATAALVVKKAATPDNVPSNDKRATSGYKLSAHIENYYRTTKTIA